jgi:23S rRNA pseudouridine1911/1915/1917 synthase
LVTRSRFVLGPGERDRVDKVLARLMPETSRANIQRWIEAGRVEIDGRACRARDVVREGAVLEVEPLPPPPSAATPDSTVPFTVLFEDETLLVIDKPAGVVVHPARGHATGTLVNGLLARGAFDKLNEGHPDDEADEFPRPGIVHRIDKDTSGVLVVAKIAPAREGLKAQLAAHSMERAYHAITIGVPRLTSIRTTYGRDPRSRLRFTSRLQEGKSAATHLRVLETFVNGRAALVECRLETGRTHQIRVHLLEQAKAPLLGDALYKGASLPAELAPVAEALGRQALHAKVLGFSHPITGAALRFESPLPEDMAAALETLRSAT